MKHLSFVIKNGLTYFLLYLTAIGLISYFLLANSSREILHSSEKNLLHTAELASLQWSKYIEELRYDIEHIAHSPYLAKYIRDKEEKDRQMLIGEYLSLVQSKPHFSQIRYLEASSGGKEVVRVERSESGVSAVSADNLQVKGERNYYKEAVLLPRDSIYFSNIDLNKEHGQISQPHTPTLRVAIPVFSEDKLNGVLVINTNLNIVFQALRNLVALPASLSMVDDQGFYLYHRDPEQTFGFEFGRAASFANDFGAAPHELAANDVDIHTIGETLFTLKDLRFPKQHYRTYIVISADKEALLASYYSWRNKSFFIIISLGILSLALAMLLMKNQARELRLITNKMIDFADNPDKSDLLVKRTDEIGDLAKGFSRMANEIHHNLELLTSAKSEAEAAVKEKEEFLENMSHEIRNPLQSIIGISTMLGENNPQPHQVNLIDSLRSNAHNLRSLVSDVLDFKKLLRNELELNPDWVNLSVLGHEIIKMQNYQASLAGVKLALKMDAGLDGKEIHTDALRLIQILNNLISNAIKFTPNGGTVDLVIRTAEAGSALEFCVRDTGAGIPDEALEVIKERYVSSGKNPGFTDGFGLGLTIVSQLLHKFHSVLTIQSEEGKGSAFSFIIRSDVREAGRLKAQQAAPAAPDPLLQCRILVIEDDEQINLLYRHILADRVGELVFAPSVSDVLHREGPPFDVVVCDAHLGAEKVPFTTEFFSAVLHDAGRIIAVSGKTPDVSSDLRFPIVYFRKPFVQEEFLTAVGHAAKHLQYGTPYSRSIQEDYDFDAEKYTAALKLLVDEWRKAEEDFRRAFDKKDFDQFVASRHKMITTVRRLKLGAFEGFLSKVEQNDVVGENEALWKKLRDRIRFFIACIQQEVDLKH